MCVDACSCGARLVSDVRELLNFVRCSCITAQWPGQVSENSGIMLRCLPLRVKIVNEQLFQEGLVLGIIVANEQMFRGCSFRSCS